jgi:hypothetical protein
MALPISVTYTFATATSAIPLSQLDANFTTVVNAINGIGNGTNALANVQITGGTITGLSSAIPVASGGTGLQTLTANAVVIGNGTSNVAFVSPGTSGNVLTSDGTNWSSSLPSSLVASAVGDVPFSTNGTSYAATQKIVLGTTVAATTGTSIDFTGIPSWVKRVTVMLSGVSTTGSSPMILQIGSGSVQTSGYSGFSQTGTTSGTATTAGFNTTANPASTATRTGHAVFTAMGSNVWVVSGIISDFFTSGGSGTIFSGNVTLSGALDRVRLTTIGGSNTFDAGSVNIMYE